MDDEIETARLPKSGGMGMTLAMIIFAFIGGIGVMAWAVSSFDFARNILPQSATPQPVEAEQTPPPTPGLVQPIAPPSSSILPSLPVGDVETRIAEVETRLARIGQSASVASDNAKRAEGLLLAFAARRAIDRGLGLGYVEAQLDGHFGATQPRAVAMIIAAARDPVTLDQLKSELEALAPKLTTRGANQSWWQTAQQTMSGLFVVRKEGVASAAPVDRFERAKSFITSGRVDLALAEVARLPGRESAAGWIARARRQIEANRALDLIEAAALTASDTPSAPPAIVLPELKVPSGEATPEKPGAMF